MADMAKEQTTQQNIISTPMEQADKMEADLERVRTLLRLRYPDTPPLAYVHSYGCQQNVSDGEKLQGLLAAMGYGFGDCPETAELVLFNTCAVRENAEDRVFGNVGALKAAHQAKPDMLICLCGCMIQQEHIAEKIRRSYPYVDLAFGTHAIREFPSLLYQALAGASPKSGKSRKRVIDITEYDTSIPEGVPARRESTFKAGLPVMYGCNNFCTYCIVPYVRGRERSRKSEDIIKEFRQLVSSGCKEIMLLGQNVNSYGKGLAETIDFAALLRMLNAVEGDFRIRFMTSHPKDATMDLIDAIAECDKVCGHFHLPVQSGSDRILEQMNRRYTVADYMRLVEYAREKIPEISFTTDIIVGFPGETEEDFNSTLTLLGQVEYDNIYSFIYSKRTGTKAAGLPDNTPYRAKAERFSRLLGLQREITARRFQAFVGRTFRVLADGEGKTAGMLTGRTDSNLIVEFAGQWAQIGSFVNVKITRALAAGLVGEITEPQAGP